MSNWSKLQPINFNDGESSGHQNCGLASVKIHQKASESPPDHINTDLGSVFKELEENIIAFVRSELKKLKKVLCPLKPSDSDRLTEDDEDEPGRGARDAFLRITMHFLRGQKQERLAELLQSKSLVPFCQQNLKSNLKRRFQHFFEGVSQAGRSTLLNQVYTELHITEKGQISDQHDFQQMEAESRSPADSQIISCGCIFKPVAGGGEPARTVVTKGVAGVGKTVLTRKFTLDWAEGKANHSIQFIFPLAFRELNPLMTKNYSLVGLIHHFFSGTKKAIRSFEELQVVFILDGLDECRPPLDFRGTPILTDPMESTSVHALLTNLIKGKLLPSARVWITTRPAAANQIPPDCVDMVTEVRGFTDPQKEQYFKKRVTDENQARRIISHVGESRSLHIMCRIPLFCWITATVLDQVLKSGEKSELPKTLTAMYTHFLVVQTKLDNVRYSKEAETDPVWSTVATKTILALGRLAFEQLEKGNLIFYEEDLKEYGIDPETVFSGVFTEIFKEQGGLNQKRVFGFVHLSMQEFLAALYVFLMFRNHGKNLLSNKSLPIRRESKFANVFQNAVDKALQSPNGHLDMFVRFLLGLSLTDNQALLGGLMTRSRSEPQVKDTLVVYIKKKIRESPSTERSIHLFHWLNELNDHSLEEEVQRYLTTGSGLKRKLTPPHWSALVFILLSSQKDLEVFDLKKFSASKEALVHLLPVVKASKKSLLSGCNLSPDSCTSLLPALTSEKSCLRLLDLSDNNLYDRGVKALSNGLKSPNCKLEVLRLSGCLIKEEGCSYLASALSTNPSHLRELDLSFNHLGGPGLIRLSEGLQDPSWKLETLKTDNCGKFRLKPSPLRYLCELTLDPNSADRNLQLSQDRKQVLLVREKQPYPDHPDRFEGWKQLLCREALIGRCYWEVEWKGRVRIGVTYRGIRRRGDSDECGLGWNQQSWSLSCTSQGFTAWQNNTASDIGRPPQRDRGRVAVYVDWSAGTVSFYQLPVPTGDKILLHTFQSEFTEPLYAAFGFGRSLEFESTFVPSSVSLSKLED
ncbi:protein NLRC3-like [Menidia menidia]